MPSTRGFFDSATAAGSRTGQRGAPAFGSPSAGNTITEATSFGWLDRVSELADNAVGVINSVKGAAAPKPAEALQKPTAVGGLNPQILYIGGAILVVILAVMFLKK